VTITVTAAQVPSFLKGSASDADVTAALSWAAGAVEAYCERDFSYRANDVVLVDPFPVRRSAQLPNPPVHSISTVEAYMRDANGQVNWQTLVNWAWTAEGLVYDTTGQPGTQISEVPSWPALPKSLRITYTHGFMDVPQPVVDAVVKAASNYLNNPFQMTQRRVGDVSYQWSDRGGESLLDTALLGKYRLITVPR
jgi:hypothetical protein